MAKAAAAVVALGLAVTLAHAAPRSKAAIREFRAANPCPSSGKTTGRCENYVIDHQQPLCAGGADTAANMQWQHVDDAREKDAAERRLCAKLRAERGR